MRYRLGKGVQEARRLQLTHPQPWQWLCFPGGNSEPKNSSVGTGLGKNSSVGHIPASLAARHQRAHVEPHCREGTGQGAGRRWTQTEPGAGETPGCCLGEAELVSGGVRGGGGGQGTNSLVTIPASPLPRKSDRPAHGPAGSSPQEAEDEGANSWLPRPPGPERGDGLTRAGIPEPQRLSHPSRHGSGGVSTRSGLHPPPVGGCQALHGRRPCSAGRVGAPQRLIRFWLPCQSRGEGGIKGEVSLHTGRLMPKPRLRNRSNLGLDARPGWSPTRSRTNKGAPGHEPLEFIYRPSWPALETDRIL